MSSPDVVIAGAGMAGLCCGIRLAGCGLSIRIFEASDAAGGRVRTDECEGFRLDRGFQVLLTAYPEARRMLDFGALRLGEFEPGAMVRFAGRFHTLADPLRRPGAAIGALFSPVGTLGDKLRVLKLRQRLRRESDAQVFDRRETETLAALRNSGFSDLMVERFFRPFLGGIFLDPALETSSRMFEFVYRMFALGNAALPAGGMGAIAAQLVSRLPSGALQLNTPVKSVEAGRVTLESGEELRAQAVVVATDGAAAARLTGRIRPPAGRSCTCVYYASPEPPISGPWLVLNGDRRGPVNNLSVPSEVAAGYAPANQSLISATVLGEGGEQEVLEQMTQWFGKSVRHWRHLKTYRIPFALPAQPPGWLEPPERPVCLAPGLYLCGDYRDNASIQGAMVSGRRAADALLDELKHRR